MSHFYSPETKGFYHSEIHADMPEDVFEVSDELYSDLIVGQSQGTIIVYQNRQLKLVNFVPPPITWEGVRNLRNRRLSACDWTQLSDAQLSSEDRIRWAAYRQELRDITIAFDSPSDVVWPLSPDQTAVEE